MKEKNQIPTQKAIISICSGKKSGASLKKLFTLKDLALDNDLKLQKIYILGQFLDFLQTSKKSDRFFN